MPPHRTASQRFVTADSIYGDLKCRMLPLEAVREFDGSRRMLRMLVILRYVVKIDNVFVPAFPLDEHDMKKWLEKMDGMDTSIGSPSSEGRCAYTRRISG